MYSERKETKFEQKYQTKNHPLPMGIGEFQFVA